MKIRNLFHLRIRDLFFLVAISAILIAWRMDRFQLASQIPPAFEATPYWQTEQALGPPNSNGPGDLNTSWASETPDGGREWLELTYDRWSTPSSIEIHETYNPGAIDKVTMFDWRNREKTVWQGTADLTKRPNQCINIIKLSKSFRTKRIKIYINSPSVSGWNEIDAVGLVGSNGKKIWASKAKASSSYAELFSPQSGLVVQPIFRNITPGQ